MNASDQQKIRECLDLLQHAQSIVDEAAQALCPVAGFADQWSSLHKPYDAIKAAWHRVESRRMGIVASERTERGDA